MAIDKKAWNFLVSNNAGRSFPMPWQMLTGGVKVPEFIEKMIPGHDSADYDTRQDAYWKAGMVHTMLCAAILGAGITGAAKGIQYLTRRTGVGETDNPAKGIASKLNATYAPLSGGEFELEEQKKGQDKKASEENKWFVPLPDWNEVFTKRNFGAVALPLAAMTIAAALTDIGADKATGAMDEARIEKKLDRRTKLRNDHITARAMNAYGNLSQEQLDVLNARAESEDIGIGKKAFWTEAGSALTAAVGLLATAITGASFIGMYQYTKASDPNNIRYRAIKKGLNEYAKQKAGISPITIETPSDEYFAYVDNGKNGSGGSGSPRDEQNLSDQTFNNPVSVSFD